MSYHLSPLTDQALRFAGLYGEFFDLLGSGPSTLQLVSLQTGRLVKVDKRAEGIYVNGAKFCDSWVDAK